MAEKIHRWFKIAESAAELFNTGRQAVQVRVAGRDICITRHNHELYGCSAKCPHAGGRLCEGWVDALGNIVCPLHRYRFRLANGFNSSGEGFYLRTYPVKETDDGLFVGLEL